MVSVRFAQMSEFFCLIKAPLQIFRRYEILRNFDTIMNIAYLKKRSKKKLKLVLPQDFPIWHQSWQHLQMGLGKNVFTNTMTITGYTCVLLMLFSKLLMSHDKNCITTQHFPSRSKVGNNVKCLSLLCVVLCRKIHSLSDWYYKRTKYLCLSFRRRLNLCENSCL